MSTDNNFARRRTSLVCPECRELSRLKGPQRRFRCPNGHSYPIEVLLVLKERRLGALGWTLSALERSRPISAAQPREDKPLQSSMRSDLQSSRKEMVERGEGRQGSGVPDKTAPHRSPNSPSPPCSLLLGCDTAKVA